MAERGAPGLLAAARAGAAYFAPVFAAGFALGALRVLVLAPALGETAAVLVELPVMLALSWRAAGWAAARCGAPGRVGPRLVMGGVAFVLLMAAEFALWRAMADGGAGDFLGRYAAPHALLGLLGQLGFAAIPALRLAFGDRRGRA